MISHKLFAFVPLALIGSIQEFIVPLVPFFGLMLVVVLSDLWFGLKAAKARRDKIRFSSAGRRTVGKFVDYICWIFIAATFDMVLTTPLSIPLFRYIILLVVFGFEIESCFSNYFAAKGKNIKINLFGFLRKKTDIIEMEEKQDETK